MNQLFAKYFCRYGAKNGAHLSRIELALRDQPLIAFVLVVPDNLIFDRPSLDKLDGPIDRKE